MPDDNRFAGLSAGLEEDDPDEEEEAADRSPEVAESVDDPEPTSADTAVSESTDGSDAPDDDESDAIDADGSNAATTDEGGPAFEFDETTAKSIYVREETLALLEDTEFEVEMHLRRNHGVRDVTGREFHDAAVHVLENHVDEVVEAVLAARDGEQ